MKKLLMVIAVLTLSCNRGRDPIRVVLDSRLLKRLLPPL